MKLASKLDGMTMKEYIASVDRNRVSIRDELRRKLDVRYPLGLFENRLLANHVIYDYPETLREAFLRFLDGEEPDVEIMGMSYSTIKRRSGADDRECFEVIYLLYMDPLEGQAYLSLCEKTRGRRNG